jgi:hypothetical protein
MVERTKSRIPKFRSREEEAQFWETHDVSDFEDVLKEVKVTVARPLEHHLSVRLDAAVITQLTQLAREIGIGPSTLARMWIMDRLNHERKKRAGKSRVERG